VDIQLVPQHPIDPHPAHRPHGKGSGNDLDPAFFDGGDDRRDAFLRLDERIRVPHLPDIVAVRGADQRFPVPGGDFDGLLVGIDEGIVEERELDGVKSVEAGLQFRPEAS
jgi:hypothetical protein